MQFPETMSELFEKSLPAALQAGISVFDYWEMTWNEIRIVLKAYEKSLILQQKQRAIMDHAFIGMLGRMPDGKKVNLYESYPKLFEEENKRQMSGNAKQKLLNYAMKHNKEGQT